MPIRRTPANVQTYVGNQNLSTTPKTVGVHASLAVGDLVVLTTYIAQGNGVTQTAPAPTGMTKVSSDGSTTNRVGGVFYAIADAGNLATLNALTQTSNSTTSRVVIITEVWTPDSGYHWDASTAAAVGPLWYGSAHSSATWPTDTLGTKTLKLGASMTNKSASTTLSTHTAAGGGTDTEQGMSPSAATNGPPNTVSVSDSASSITVGGTGVTYNVSQANGQTYLFGIDQVSDAPVPEVRTATGSLTLSGSADGTVAGGVQTRTATGTVTLSGAATATSNVGLPTVTGHGFVNITQMMETPGTTFAHRNLGGSYPEMTEWGIRTAANLGHGVIEISCQRDSQGTWWGIHDQTPDRVAVQTIYDGQQISSLTTAQVASLTINVGSTGAPQPFATLQTLLNTLPSDFVYMVDPKQSGGTPAYMTEFLDILDANGGPTKIFVKVDGAATATRFIAAQARGYKTSAYYYAAPATPTNPANVAANIPYVDIPGLNYDASQSDWNTYLAYGKPMWAHVIPDQTGYNTSITRGAKFVQVTSATITPVGVSAWPGTLTRTAAGSLALSGSATASAAGGTQTRTATGTLTLAGTAADGLATSATGTLTVSGSAPTVVAHVRTSVGSLALSGTASADTAGGAATRTAQGTLTASGTASVSVRAITTAEGQVTLTGLATVAVRVSRTATGTATLSGTGAVQLVESLVRTATGIINLTGTAYIGDLPTLPDKRTLRLVTRRKLTLGSKRTLRERN